MDLMYELADKIPFNTWVVFGLAVANNIFMEFAKKGIKSIYSDCTFRAGVIIAATFVLGVGLYVVYVLSGGKFDALEAILTPAFSLVAYEFKPYQRILKWMSGKADEKGASDA